jgi:hypothetical protein
MINNFNGSLNFVLVCILALGGIYYASRCLFSSKSFSDQYGFGDSSIFMTRFAGSCVAASTILVIMVIVRGPTGAWEVFAFGVIQSAIATVSGFFTVNGPWAEVEGVKATAEGWIAPLGFLIVNLYLMFALSGVLYM